MHHKDTTRLSRLTAIVTLLQSKRILTARYIAEKFSISLRTVYRDIKALEEAGVPIVTEEGKGYSLIEGYRIPPVMFTEDEANALITADWLIKASKDESLIKQFSSAIQKIKAVIPGHLKERTETLEAKLAIANIYIHNDNKSQHLLLIQKALLECWVITIEYTSLSGITSTRAIEPFAIYSNEKDEWGLIAHCRIRNDFRSFLLHRIKKLTLTTEKYTPHPMTLDQYRKKVYGD